MAASSKHKKHMEDDFELDSYIRSQERKARFKAFREKNQKLLTVLTALITVMAFILAWVGYSVISYSIDLWRNEQLIQKGFSANDHDDLNNPVETEEINNVMPFKSITPQDVVQVTEEPPTERPILDNIIKLRTEFQNDDIIGYINIPETKINFPVCQTSDNNFYLNHNLKKEENVAGAAFFDTTNKLDALDYNTVIYAHNMRNGSMFHNLRNYTEKEFFKSHRIINLQILYEDTVWEIFSFYSSSVDFNYIRIDFSSQQDFFDNLLKLVKDKSLYDTGVEISPQDKILTLSTCTNRVDDSRYVVHAKLVE